MFSTALYTEKSN